MAGLIYSRKDPGKRVKTVSRIRSDGFAHFCLFVGCIALVDLVWFFFSAAGSSFRSLKDFGLFLLLMTAVSALCIGSLRWGFCVLGPRARKPFGFMLAIMVLLSPGIFLGTILMAQIAVSEVTNAFFANEVVFSSTSPNGHHQAEVLKKKSELGSWVQRYYVRVNGGRRIPVGRTEKYTQIQAIHWSPDSAMVVFDQELSAVGYRISDGKICHAMFPSGSKTGKHGYYDVQRIDFPDAFKFVISYKDFPTSQTVDFTDRYALPPPRR